MDIVDDSLHVVHTIPNLFLDIIVDPVAILDIDLVFFFFFFSFFLFFLNCCPPYLMVILPTMASIGKLKRKGGAFVYELDAISKVPNIIILWVRMGFLYLNTCTLVHQHLLERFSSLDSPLLFMYISRAE